MGNDSEPTWIVAVVYCVINRSENDQFCSSAGFDGFEFLHWSVFPRLSDSQKNQSIGSPLACSRFGMNITYHNWEPRICVFFLHVRIACFADTSNSS